MALHAYADRDNVGLPGLAAWFKRQSDGEREHALRLTHYQVTFHGSRFCSRPRRLCSIKLLFCDKWARRAPASFLGDCETRYGGFSVPLGSGRAPGLQHQCSIFSAAVLLPPPDELLRHIM